GPAVETELADALGDLGDQQVVAVELPGGEREVDAVVLEVDREDASPDLGALHDVRERSPWLIPALRLGPDDADEGCTDQQWKDSGMRHAVLRDQQGRAGPATLEGQVGGRAGESPKRL